jgi:phosphate-selective porin OprO/OprP
MIHFNLNLHPEIMKAVFIAAGMCVLNETLARPVQTDERDDRIRALEKRVEQLEKLLSEREIKPSLPAPTTSAAEAPKPGPTVSVGASGFTMRSADTNFVLRIRGLLQVDSRWYADDGIRDNDGFVLRRARPILEGTVFRDFDFLLTPDFGGSTPVIRDAWLNYQYSPPLQLRFGKMKPPGGLERWQSAGNLTFIERAMVSGLWPSRDLGVMLHGELWPGDETDAKRLATGGLVHYALGGFNGAGDDRLANNTDFDGNPGVAARLFFHPFLKTDLESLRNLGLGVAGTYGDPEGAVGLPAGGAYGTEGQQDMFSYLSGDGTTPATANVIAQGNHWRLGPQAYWYWGPLGLLGEYGISSQELQRSDGTLTNGRLTHRGWMLAASWLLTGEDATFRAVSPKRNVDLRTGGWGALQFVVRYSVLDMDDDAFPNFADPAESATRANAWGVGLNWYLNRNVRAGLDFSHTDFTGGADGAVTGQDENVFLTRMQLAF